MSEQVRFGVQGMTCAACVGRVERTLRKQAGVDSATVNLATEQAVVTFDPAVANVVALKAAVHDAGYDAVDLDDGARDGDAREGEQAELKRLTAHEQKLTEQRRNLLDAVAEKDPGARGVFEKLGEVEAELETVAGDIEKAQAELTAL